MRPFFGILVTAYNREQVIERCVRSALEQSFADLEVVVVDDASTDATCEKLAAISDARLRVISHDENQGISSARATSVDGSRGQWLVMLDSDWVLLPESLDRLRAATASLPEGVRIIRGRISADDGQLLPSVMPARITGYTERLRWLEEIARCNGGSDAVHCIHRSVFENVNYYRGRRGPLETLWELDLARSERSLWLGDVLAHQYADADNSVSRDSRPEHLIPRLRAEAPDVLWMAERMLTEHGQALEQYAPSYRRYELERAFGQAFLAGRRLLGLRYARAALAAGTSAAKVAVNVVLGLLGPGALARAVVLRRGLGTRSRQLAATVGLSRDS